MLLEAVELDAIGVVDVDVLLLGHGKELVVVEEAGVPDGLAQLQLAPQLALAPVHGRDVALPPSQNEVPAVSAVLAHIRPQRVKLELKFLLCHVDADLPLDVVLAHLVGPLELRLGLQESRRVFEQDLGLLGF